MILLRNAVGGDCWCTPARHLPRLPPRRPPPLPTTVPCAFPLTMTCVNHATFDHGMALVHVACVHRADHPRFRSVPQQDDYQWSGKHLYEHATHSVGDALIAACLFLHAELESMDTAEIAELPS